MTLRWIGKSPETRSNLFQTSSTADDEGLLLNQSQPRCKRPQTALTKDGAQQKSSTGEQIYHHRGHGIGAWASSRKRLPFHPWALEAAEWLILGIPLKLTKPADSRACCTSHDIQMFLFNLGLVSKCSS